VPQPEMSAIPCRVAPDDVQAFLFYEAQLLNELRFDDWLELFSEDAQYWVPARPDQQSGEDQVSLFYDDKELLSLRVKRLGHPLLHSQDPMTRSVRLLSNITVAVDSDPDAPLVRSCFVQLDYRQHVHRFFGGTYEHRLRRDAQRWQIAAKTVRLLNCDDHLSNMGIPL
jgi:3-phenylpropionate/cinnamic acid dioxygenase small subunit